MTAGKNHSYSAKAAVVKIRVRINNGKLTSPNFLIRRRNENWAKRTKSTDNWQQQGLWEASFVRFTETSKIGHIDSETGEQADDYVERLEGRPYAAHFGIDNRWAMDKRTSIFGYNNSLDEPSAKVKLELRMCSYP